jgi:hypothetical protein
MSSESEQKLLREAEQAWRAGGAALGDIPVLLVVALALRTLLQYQLTWGASLGFGRLPLGLNLALLAATAPLGIVLHEFGHWVSGVLLQQYCRRIVIGPVELVRRGGRWALRFVPIRHAGLVDFVPSTFAHFRLKRALCIASGPAASLLGGLVFTALAFQANTSTKFWIASDCTQWALIGFLGVMPFRRGDLRSDGSLLWDLIRGGRTADETERDLLVASSYATTLRMREWPRDLIERLWSTANAPRYDAYLAYVFYLDSREHAHARDCLTRLTSDWNADDPAEYALEAAYFHALFDDDLAAAEMWLSREESSYEPWVHLRAEAAVRRAGGDRDGAHAKAQEARELLERATPCGAYRYELDRLDDLMERSPANLERSGI